MARPADLEWVHALDYPSRERGIPVNWLLR
jgi:hypothetical protein